VHLQESLLECSETRSTNKETTDLMPVSQPQTGLLQLLSSQLNFWHALDHTIA
jgi:hypothetical protein